MTQLKIALLSPLARMPQYAREGDSGMDLCAAISEPVTLHACRRVTIPTGIAIELPPGYEAQVRTRSGLAANNGVIVLNSPGTVDNSYRGEIKVVLWNSSFDLFDVQPGMRIAQLVIAPVARVTPVQVLADELTSTERGTGGLGHSGVM